MKQPFAALSLLAGITSASAQEAPPPAPLRIETVVLVESGGEWARFGTPAACQSGFAVFHAARRGAGEALLVSSGGRATTLIATGSELSTARGRFVLESIGAEPGVNDAQHVAFRASFADGSVAIVVADGFERRFEFIADSTEAFREFSPAVAINRAGEVAFHATVDPPGHPDRDDGLAPVDGQDVRDAPERFAPPKRLTFAGSAAAFEAGLFVERGGKGRIVGRTSEPWLDVLDGFALGDGGSIAYRAAPKVGHWSVRVDGGAFARSIATTGGAPQERFGPLAMNGAGEVAFVRWSAEGIASVCRGVVGRSEPEVVLDRAAGFVDFSPDVAIDPAGRIAFVGRRADGSAALCVAPDAAHVTELFPVGALLAGRRVTALALGSRAFARSDRLALRAELDDGNEAVFLLYARR
ncbi:MAG: hypothetical protein ACKVXR_16795 [Planctomycetota bacterium]